MLEEYVDKFKASLGLLVVAGVLFLAAAGTGVVLLTREGEFSCSAGDGAAELQKSLDSVLSQYEKWMRSPDGSWHRKAKVTRRDVYRVEDHGGQAYIVLRGADKSTQDDESKWIVVQNWCSASEFLDDVPKVSRGGPTTVPG